MARFPGRLVVPLGRWLLRLSLVITLVGLTGCEQQVAIYLPYWTFEAEGRSRPVELPSHLDAFLPDRPGRFALKAHVSLPDDYVGAPLVFAIPFFQGRMVVTVNGEPTKFLDEIDPHSYRYMNPHTFWISPAQTRQRELDVVMMVEYRTFSAGWFDTIPRMSATPRGDRSVRLLKLWNDVTGYLALTISLMGVLVNLAYFVTTRDRKDAWTAVAGLLVGVYPAYWIGFTQSVFGLADGYVLCVVLVAFSMLILRATTFVERYPLAVSIGELLITVLCLVYLPSRNPFHGFREFSFLVLSLQVLVGCAWYFQPARDELVDVPAADRFLRLTVPIGMLIALPDAFILLGYGSLTQGVRTGVFAVAVGNFVGITGAVVRYFEMLRRAMSLKESLQERVAMFEERNQQVQELNAELRRQLSSNAAELAQALVLASKRDNRRGLEFGEIVDGRYRLDRPLGEGGMGAVYEATRLMDGLPVAIKFILGPRSPEANARFAREAESALKVQSDRVVAIRDVGATADGVMFVVMDLVPGSSLAEEVSRFGDVPWCLSILKQVAEGLVAIHAVGVVHRDIKPRNILLSYPDGPDKPHAKITDFGIAAIRTAVGSEDATLAVGAGLTRTGMILGTPEYMAPEAFGVSSEVGPPGDMFSFGVLIRRLLRVDGESFALPLAQMLTLNPDFRLPSIATVVERVDPALVATLDACLQTEAWRRPTANDVVEALVVIEREWNGAALDEHASNAP